MSWYGSEPPLAGLLWGLGGSGSWALSCAALAFVGARLRWWPDPVPSRRGHRIVLLTASVMAGAAVWLLCRHLGAPRPLLAVGAVAPLLVALVLACTCFGKISLHTSAAAASTTLLVLLVDVRWAVLYVLVAAIAWSRLQLGAHTPPQVLTGAGLGTAVCCATAYWSR
ncbi:phosphatase PAP2 family protein [Streptomyces sp. NPDC059740]|uniref:phosphatase PAP2 family protein n=1 Tax=Streptomyces sp. NPDC059740 TaxID=3346926 RepID=UPI0036598569